jgi:hypothetical protein
LFREINEKIINPKEEGENKGNNAARWRKE